MQCSHPSSWRLQNSVPFLDTEEAILDQNQYWSCKAFCQYLACCFQNSLKRIIYIEGGKTSISWSSSSCTPSAGPKSRLRDGTSFPKEYLFFPFYSFIQHLCVSAYHVPSPMLQDRDMRKTSSSLGLTHGRLYYFTPPEQIWYVSMGYSSLIMWKKEQVLQLMCTGLRKWREMEIHLLIKSREESLIFDQDISQVVPSPGVYTVMLIPKTEKPSQTWAEHQLTAWMGLHPFIWPTGFQVEYLGPQWLLLAWDRVWTGK